MVVGALNRTVSRYCLMFRTLVVFSFMHFKTNWMCSLFNFRKRERTISWGKSVPATLVTFRLEQTTSSISSKISSMESASHGCCCFRFSYSIFSQIRSRYSWYAFADSLRFASDDSRKEGIESVFCLSVLCFSVFDFLVFNCVGLSCNGLSGVGLSDDGFSDDGFAATGRS